MTTDERYNGWTNRETWAASLWLSSDYGMYTQLNDQLTEARDNWDPDGSPFPAYKAGQVVKDFWEEITDPETFSNPKHFVEHILPMISDVGSTWRVDWDEVGAAWLSDLPEQLTTDLEDKLSQTVPPQQDSSAGIDL